VVVLERGEHLGIEVAEAVGCVFGHLVLRCPVSQVMAGHAEVIMTGMKPCACVPRWRRVVARMLPRRWRPRVLWSPWCCCLMCCSGLSFTGTGSVDDPVVISFD